MILIVAVQYHEILLSMLYYIVIFSAAISDVVNAKKILMVLVVTITSKGHLSHNLSLIFAQTFICMLCLKFLYSSGLHSSNLMFSMTSFIAAIVLWCLLIPYQFYICCFVDRNKQKE